MKKVLAFVMLVGMFSSVYGSTYECWRYVGGKPQGYVKVSASSNSEAKDKAAVKFDNIGKKVEYIKCK